MTERPVGLARQAKAEIERLQELLRGVGANRYWEGRWREEVAAHAAERERCIKLAEAFSQIDPHGPRIWIEFVAAIRKGE